MTTYSLESLQERGMLFVQPGDKVYGGQIVGESARNQDLVVNPCKAKKLDNMRSAHEGTRRQTQCATDYDFGGSPGIHQLR